jgi:hypothetical protein
MSSPTLGMKRHFNFDEFDPTSKRHRPVTSPRKILEAEKFSNDVETLQKSHPSINVDVISSILETCENDPTDASASLKLFHGSPRTSHDLSNPSTKPPIHDDILSELPSLAERLSTAIRTADTAEKGVQIAQVFLKGVSNTVTAAESKAQRNLSASKSLVKSLHRIHAKAQQTESDLKTKLAIADERVATAERSVNLLRWHLEESSKSYFPFGGGPSAGGVF